MTDEATDEEQTDGERTDEDLGHADPGQPAPADDKDDAAAEARASGPHPRRATVMAGGVAVLVLVVAAIGYQQVIPITHVARGRLAELVITQPGVKEFDTKPAQSAELPVAKTGLSVLEAAAKKSPNATGSYLVAWAGAGPNNAMESVVFLAPSADVARKVDAQILAMNLSAQALSSSQLNRLSTFTVPGVPGSNGSLYGSAANTPGASQLAVTAFQSGRLVTVTEALHPTNAQADSETATTAEFRHLRSVGPGFSLDVVHRPLTATIVWVAGAVVIALLVALSPTVVRRSRRRRQERREAEERARGSLVPGHRITKRQR